MNWLDRTISWLSPEWAWRRYGFREALRNYDAASSIRPNNGWRGTVASAESTNSGSRDILRGNARDLERNSDELGGIITALERNVVGGTGPRLQAKVRRADLALDAALNMQLEADWLKWCKPRNCDVSAQQSFAELLRMAVRRRRVDGACLFLKTFGASPDAMLPFTLQAKEVDDLDTTRTGYADNGNLIVAGIELNSYNRPVAYYFRKATADGFYYVGAAGSERIDAQNVIMWWDRMRPSQVREISMLAPTLTRIRDIREYLESVSVAKRIQACFAMFIERSSPTQNMGRSQTTRDESSNYYGRTVTPGMIYEGQPGDKVSAVTPPNTGSSERDFVNVQQRLAGAGQGLSFEVVSRDVSQSNYSSARLNRLEDEATYEMEFASLVDHVLDEVYGDFIISGVLSKRFRMPGFWDDKDRYLAHTFVAPGLPWVDPLKEVKAGTEAIATNQDSILNVCSERGLDFREVADANAEAEAYAELARKTAFEAAGLPYSPKGATNANTNGNA